MSSIPHISQYHCQIASDPEYHKLAVEASDLLAKVIYMEADLGLGTSDKLDKNLLEKFYASMKEYENLNKKVTECAQKLYTSYVKKDYDIDV